MAKLTMKKIELAAPLTDSKKIIELLQRRGVVELCSNNDEELERTSVTAVTGEFEKFRSNAVQALEVLELYAPEKQGIAEMLGGRTEVEKHAFGREAMQLEKIMNTAGEINRCSRIIAESQAEAAQLDVTCDTLKPWQSLDVPMNFHGTSATRAFIGTFPLQLTAEEIEEMLPKGCAVEIVSASKEQTNVFILCAKEAASEAEDVLRKNAFVTVTGADGKTPAETIRECMEKREELYKKAAAAEETIVSLAESRKELRFAVDYLTMRKDKYEALNSLGFTGSTFILTGYIPEKYTEPLKKEIESKYTAVINFTDPGEDEDVPVLLENSRFSAPVEGITKMYAMPSKGDVDPTPVMSFFYYLLFGMMLSDAGYGLVMVIGTVIALRKLKLEENMRKTLIMMATL